ncbi:hypothetical protein HCEG_04548 [Histoplasma capsulatum var. duboisii H88]|uniref:Uncharacterized protein n=2 Tax=Ajellomyces capsulatus TaxID=5037 RepID=F0UDX2_AJEC8|nr:hypothetical protein HCDG_06264 [Histoplasma capsulatum H143]EGC45333.1 hypothetical protein HCEG_04548 [Histoplasma capsulatum var. duboisii H88]
MSDWSPQPLVLLSFRLELFLLFASKFLLWSFPQAGPQDPRNPVMRGVPEIPKTLAMIIIFRISLKNNFRISQYLALGGEDPSKRSGHPTGIDVTYFQILKSFCLMIDEPNQSLGGFPWTMSHALVIYVYGKCLINSSLLKSKGLIRIVVVSSDEGDNNNLWLNMTQTVSFTPRDLYISPDERWLDITTVPNSVSSAEYPVNFYTTIGITEYLIKMGCEKLPQLRIHGDKNPNLAPMFALQVWL